MTEFEAKTILSPLLMIYRLRGQFRKSERTFLTRSLEEVIRNSHPIIRSTSLSKTTYSPSIFRTVWNVRIPS